MATEPLDPESDDPSLDEPVEVDDGPAIASWERQPGETPKAFHAFCHYRDLKVRSGSLAYRDHKKRCEHVEVMTLAPKRWAVWSAKWKWLDRVRAYDADLDKQVRERLIKAQVEARERHARLMQATLTTMTLPVKAVLEASQDRNFVQGLTDAAKAGPAAAMSFIRDIGRMAQAFPAVVAAERMALGMSSESVEIDDKRDDLDAILANRILEDPATTELAIQLLDRVANAGKGAAVGLGAFGEQGEMVSGSPPELPDEKAG